MSDPGNGGEAKGWLGRLRAGLDRSSGKIAGGIKGVFTKRKLDKQSLRELEDLLIGADLGVATAAKLTAALAEGRFDKEIAPAEVQAVLADRIAAILAPVARPLAADPTRKPLAVLVCGVNGSGKTTTIAKLAKTYRDQGLTVTLVAGDTFRAAAIEQLGVWAKRAGAEFVARRQGGDAAGLAFEALETARANGSDVLIIDTAGRLQNKAGLMAELEKIARVIKKLDPSSPHAALLVLDATTGQNAISQVEAFTASVPLTGLIMTKLDGTAKGGILVALAARFGLPVHYLGIGESEDDLQAFDAGAFARALAGVQ